MNPVISAADLAAALRSETPPVVLDIRYKLGGPHGIGAYREGHVPGAFFVDMDAELSAHVAAPVGEAGRHPLPDADDFAAVMRRVGVSADREVVAYDAADGVAASRVWWLLRYFGHDRVRVLDGGYQGWAGAGLPVEAADPAPAAAGDFVPKPGGLRLLDAVEAAAFPASGVLLDVRAAERFRAEAEPIDPVAGHIPGAVNAPETGTFGPDGLLLDAAALRARYAALGVAPGTAVAAYCGSGVTASHTVLALARAGIDAALYAPSWSGWISDPSRPVATGE